MIVPYQYNKLSIIIHAVCIIYYFDLYNIIIMTSVGISTTYTIETRFIESDSFRTQRYDVTTNSHNTHTCIQCMQYISSTVQIQTYHKMSLHLKYCTSLISHSIYLLKLAIIYYLNQFLQTMS